MSLRRRSLASLFAVTVALTVALTATAVASFSGPAAADPPFTYSKYHTMYNQRCLEADLGHISSNGDTVQLWDCYTDPGNQQWFAHYISAGVFKLENGQDGKCLESDLAHSGNGTPVQLWDCWNDPGNQQWHYVNIPATLWQPIAQVKLVNQLTGLCLDADLAHITSNGARMQLWGCWADPGNERWTETAGTITTTQH